MRHFDMLFSVCLLLMCVINTMYGKSSHRQMTVSVAAGTEDCFYLPEIKPGQSIDVEYQVTGSNTATGQNDITARLWSPLLPESVLLFESHMQTEGSKMIEAENEGDYKFCLDNMVSTWTDKMVWFEVAISDPQDDYEDDYMEDEDWEEVRSNNEDTESLFEMKMEDIKKSVHDVRISVGKMRHFQFMVGAQMSKDSHQVGMNLERINFWSVIHLLIMITVGFIQVYMVRQLFDDKSMIQKLTTRT